MKKLLVALALVGGVTAIAFGSFQNKRTYKQCVEKKMEKKKKCCRYTCPFS
jgi:hypothetical protein